MKRISAFIIALLFPIWICFAATDTLEGEELTDAANIEGVTTTDTVEGQVLKAAGISQQSETFEGVGLPSGWTEVQKDGDNDPDYDCTTGNCPLSGSKSMDIPDPGAGGQSKVAWDLPSDVTEFYVAFEFVMDDAPGANDVSLFRMHTIGDDGLAVVQLDINGDIHVGALGGCTDSGDEDTTITVNDTFWVKIRWKAVAGGNNSEMELWVAANTTAWGNSVSTTDCDSTSNAGRILFNNADTDQFQFQVDDVYMDDDDIPITVFQ